MENGRITYEFPSLNEVRSAAKENLSKLPEQYKMLTNPPVYPVELSAKLKELTTALTKRINEDLKLSLGGKA
jgi:nicotinate phosphoribosyltransferase